MSKGNSIAYFYLELQDCRLNKPHVASIQSSHFSEIPFQKPLGGRQCWWLEITVSKFHLQAWGQFGFSRISLHSDDLIKTLGFLWSLIGLIIC